MPTFSDETELFELALERAEERLERQMTRVRELNDEISNLRQTVRGLRGTLGLDDEVSASVRRQQQALLVGQQVARATADLITYPRVQIAGTAAADDQQIQDDEPPITSTDRVALIVDELDTILTQGQIYDEFRNRGWIDAAWGTPEATVAQAVRRAQKAGLIARIDRRHYGPLQLIQQKLPGVQDAGEQ